MKKVLLTLCLSLFTISAFAERFQDNIHSVDMGRSGEDHLIKLTSGRTVFVNSDEGDILTSPNLLPGKRVEIEIDNNLTLKSISSLPDAPIEHEAEESLEDFIDEKTTVLSSEAAARNIFNGMNRSYYRDTECSDRAHVWSYEEWKKHGLVSRKAFLFFTNTYIRNYRFNWWFHVSPYTLVNNNGYILERILDRRFTRSPLSVKNWTDIFIASNRSCPVSTYAHYRANRNGREHCYLVKTSMYYRLPLHVRRMEDYGQVKTRFNTSEVNFSYRAFSRRGAKK